MNTMLRRLLTALFFLFLILVIWWLWSMDKDKNIESGEKIDQPVVVDNESEITRQEEPPKIKFKPKKRKLKVPLVEKDLDVEVKADENGVYITKIGDREVEKQISKMPVERLTVKDGIMTFWEVNNETGKLKFQSINLGAYVDQVLEAK